MMQRCSSCKIWEQTKIYIRRNKKKTACLLGRGTVHVNPQHVSIDRLIYLLAQNSFHPLIFVLARIFTSSMHFYFRLIFRTYFYIFFGSERLGVWKHGKRWDGSTGDVLAVRGGTYSRGARRHDVFWTCISNLATTERLTILSCSS